MQIQFGRIAGYAEVDRNQWETYIVHRSRTRTTATRDN